jgi:hypothetical protein
LITTSSSTNKHYLVTLGGLGGATGAVGATGAFVKPSNSSLSVVHNATTSLQRPVFRGVPQITNENVTTSTTEFYDYSGATGPTWSHRLVGATGSTGAAVGPLYILASYSGWDGTSGATGPAIGFCVPGQLILVPEPT